MDEHYRLPQRQRPSRRLHARRRRPPTRSRARASASPPSSAGRPTRTIFTKNATEAINLVAYAWGREHVARRRRGAHHRDGAPLQHRALAAALPGDRRRAALPRRLRRRARSRSTSSTPSSRRAACGIAAFAHVSNVLGTINPVAEMVAPRPRRRRARADRRLAGRPAAAGRPGRDRRRLLRAGPATRRSGPPGIGVLHGRAGDPRGDAPVPRRRRHDPPRGLPGARRGTTCRGSSRPGTSMVAEAVGLGAAVDYLSAVGMDRVRAHERELTRYALERLAELPGVTRDRAGGRGGPRRRDLLRGRRHAPARRRRAHQPRERLRARRPPLRPAADAPPRRPRDGAGELRALQRAARTSTPSSTRSPRRARSSVCPRSRPPRSGAGGG